MRKPEAIQIIRRCIHDLAQSRPEVAEAFGVLAAETSNQHYRNQLARYEEHVETIQGALNTEEVGPALVAVADRAYRAQLEVATLKVKVNELTRVLGEVKKFIEEHDDDEGNSEVLDKALMTIARVLT